MNDIELVLLGNLTIGEQDDVVMVLFDYGYDVIDLVEYDSEVVMDVQVFENRDLQVIEDIMRNEFSDIDYEIRG